MNTFKMMLHDWKYRTKTNLSKWTPAIKTTIMNYRKEVTIQELAKSLTDGQTVILGNLEYSQDEKVAIKNQNKKIAAAGRHWKSQQVFAVDIDNDMYSEGDPKYITIDKAIRMCKKLKCPPAFIYTTLSHKEEWHKFRVVFVMSEEITTFDKRTKVLESIFEIFTINRECLVDTKCSDPARIFYPGKELVYTDYEATIDPDSLITRIKPTYKLEIATTVSSNRSVKGLPVSENKIVNLLRKDKYDEAKDIIANSLESAGKPYTDWLYEGSAKGGIVTIYIYIKDYCPANGQHPLKPVFIRDPEDYYELASHFPLDVMLGVNLNEHFRCILPDHHDSTPSARIEKKEDDDSYIYHCYGCMGEHKYYDIFNLLEHAVGWSHAKTKEFINYLLNVEFETEWQKERKEDISLYIDYVMGDMFEKRFPFLYKELVHSNSYSVLNFMLLQARRSIYDHLITKSDNPIFFTGLRQLSQKMKANNITRGISNSSLQRKLKFITKLKLLESVPDNSLPVEFITMSHKKRQKKGYRYRINYFEVPIFSFKLLAEAEEIARREKESGVKRRYQSRQSELWANGKEIADELYVQDKNIGKSKETIEFYKKYKDVALELLEKGYTTEKELLSHRRIRGMKKRKELSATVLPQLLQEVDLQVVRYSKYYKELFQINQGNLRYGSSKMIVRSKDVRKD